MTTTIKLKGYQKQGIQFVERQRRGLVVLGVGKGKTEIALRAMDLLESPTLVVCPKSLVGQWETYRSRFKTPMLIIAASQVKNNHDRIREFRPSLTIVDEPKFLKSDTLIFREMLKIKTRRRLILDATPFENNLDEAWFLFRWLKPNLFGSLEDFRQKFGGFNGKYHNIAEFRKMIEPHIFAPALADARQKEYKMLRIRPEFDEVIETEYHDLASRLYRTLSGKGVYRARISKGLISKLRSFLSDVKRGGGIKVRTLRKVLKSHPEFRGVIFVYRKNTAKALVKRLRQDGHKAELYTGDVRQNERERLRKEFNNHSIRFLVATSAGECGIDLPTGNMVVHLDLPWTRSAYDQRDRVSRLSSDQKVPSTILTIVLKDTVEEIMWSIVCAKRDLMLKPFDPKVDSFTINKKSWTLFLRRQYGKTSNDPRVAGKGSWFTKGYTAGHQYSKRPGDGSP